MQRRHFLGLLGAPAVLAALQACSGDESPDDSGKDTDQGNDDHSGGVVMASVSRRDAQLSEVAPGVAAVNDFAARAYGRLASSSESNLVWSPASVAIALAMTRQGAAGVTGNEMDSALGWAATGAESAVIAPSMNALTAQLEERTGSFEVSGEQAEVTLAIANSLWGQRDIDWEGPFLDTLAREFGAGMRTVDYAAHPEAARDAINHWVADETVDRIPELLAEGTVTRDLRLTLVNAIYMKAPWLVPFAKERTVDASFTTLTGGQVSVTTMATSETMRYAESSAWQAVEIPYAGGELAMLVVVPAVGAFADVEADVAGGGLATVAADLADRQVNLSLPRFDIESRAEMTGLMKSLGMNLAFEPGAADFSAMTMQEQLFVGFIVHQANITVDEDGTEAAAATAVGVGVTSAPGEPPVEVVVDRPFIFAIRDTVTGCLVFMGRVGDPS